MSDDLGWWMSLGPAEQVIAWAELLGPDDRAAMMSLARRHPDMGTGLGLWRDNPEGFSIVVLDEYPWGVQAEVMRSVVDHRRTVVPSCHDSGKSWAASRILAWWIGTRRPGDAMALTTAPTWNQVLHVLWGEVAMAHAKGELPGTLTLDARWHLHTPEGVRKVVAMGRKPADHQPGAFQGIHEREVLVVIDEADEVHPNIFDAIETAVTNDLGRVLAIGNPVNPDSPMARAEHHPDYGPTDSRYRSLLGWWVIRIDGHDTPNWTGEWVPPRVGDLLLGHTWVEEYALKHGSDSPLFRSRVRGIRPQDAEDGVIPLSWLRDRCRHLHEPPEGMVDPDTGRAVGLIPRPAAELWPPEDLTPTEIGVDVGGGTDRTVIAVRDGRRLRPFEASWVFRSNDPQTTAQRIIDVARDVQATVVKVDSIGIGWGIYGAVQAALATGVWVCRVEPVNVGERAPDPVRFPLLRDQLWWEVGRALTEGGVWDLSDGPEELLSELAAPRYTEQLGGRVKVEPKSDTTARLGLSPDLADAVLLAYLHLPEHPDGIATWDQRVTIGRA